jgi:transmembrane sensor
MTMSERQVEEGDEALARKAAHWFARMRGPDADASRAEFEAWLARGPEYRAAYNDTAEVFAMGKLLADPGELVPAPPQRRPVLAMALTTVAACVIGVGAWVATHPPGPAADRREAIAGMIDHRRISAAANGARVMRLADGSTVRLGEGTILDVDVASGQRSLRLLQGQARFEVAHEQRPFIVLAGGGSVTARGTIFDVALARSGTVDVRLLQGAVDVAMPHQSPTGAPAMRRLSPGEGVSFTAQPDIP